MANPRRVSTRRAVLGYEHLKQLTNWSELVVKDYQGILQDTSFLADEIDAIEARVVNNEEDIEALQEDVADLKESVELLEYKKFVVVTTDESLTTSQFQIIICNNLSPIEITLKPNAVKDDELHIKRNGEQVTLKGNVNGLSDRVLNIPQWSDHLVFNGVDWSTI